jgi:uncharacterized protein YkwD
VLFPALYLSATHLVAGTPRFTPRLLHPAQVSPTPPPAATGAAARCATTGTGCVCAVLNLMNTARAQYHEPPLTLSWTQTHGIPGECAGSIAHSRAMAEDGAIWHVSARHRAESFPAGLCRPFTYIGENVGMATGTRWSGVQQIEALMMSEPHGRYCTRDNHACNILSPHYTNVGIGIVSASGTVWVTEDFRG